MNFSTILVPCIIRNAVNMGHRHKNKQITGIEPASSAWEADVLPMNYICMFLV